MNNHRTSWLSHLVTELPQLLVVSLLHQILSLFRMFSAVAFASPGKQRGSTGIDTVEGRYRNNRIQRQGTCCSCRPVVFASNGDDVDQFPNQRTLIKKT
jgi:hypothetical protein